MLEGYWPGGLFEPIRGLGLWIQLQRFDWAQRSATTVKRKRGAMAELTASAIRESAEERLQLRFPDSEARLMPTALGNVLRSAEDRAGLRYGMRVVTLWPRIYATLPEEFRKSLEDEVTQLDVSCRLTVTWLLTAVATSAILLSRPADLLAHNEWLLVASAIWLLAWLAYRSAIEAAEAHGVDIEVALDLYRHLLVDAMRLEATTSLSQDREIFPTLSELFETYDEGHNLELHYRRGSS